MDIYDIDVAVEMKLQQFKQKNINVTEEDIRDFLEKIYFKHHDDKKRLTNFVKDDNITDIVNFLMSEAIINPKIKFK